MKTKDLAPRYLTVAGRRFVILPEEHYLRLKEENNAWEPPLPEPDEDGNYPAVEYAAASIARDILRARRRLGLSQDELARRAGIRAETLKRIEHAQHTSSIKAIDKIDRALKKAEREGNRKG